MGFVYLLQLTVEKLYKKLVYSDGIGHLKLKLYIYVADCAFFPAQQGLGLCTFWDQKY